MVLRCMHECMHAARFCSAFFFFYLALQLSQNSYAFYAMKMILSPFYCTTSGAVQSPIKLVKSRNSIEEIPVVHEGWPVVWTNFALHNYVCSIAIGVVSISCLELSGLSWSPSASSFSSGERGNAILQYCYGFNSHHAAVAQPLSTGSPLVSSFSSGECGNAILHYCYGFNRRQLAQGLLQSVPSLQVSAYWGNAILQYCYGFNRGQLWLIFF